MANIVTGRENIETILSGFTTLTKRLDTYVSQQESDATKQAEAAAVAQSKCEQAKANAERGRRTLSKIAELIN